MELFGHTKDVIRANYFYLMERMCPSKISDAHDIPIIINNYNRLTMLKKLIDSLTSRGYTNIVILDNQSAYPPLLEWYAKCQFEVIRLPKNYGFKALWKYAPVRKRFCSDYYIYTDPDVQLSPECPADVVERMFHILKCTVRELFDERRRLKSLRRFASPACPTATSTNRTQSTLKVNILRNRPRKMDSHSTVRLSTPHFRSTALASG